MSERSDYRRAEAEWRDSQRGVLHDEHDSATDPESLPPLSRAVVGLVLVLVAIVVLVGWVAPYFADKVWQ